MPFERAEGPETARIDRDSCQIGAAGPVVHGFQCSLQPVQSSPFPSCSPSRRASTLARAAQLGWWLNGSDHVCPECHAGYALDEEAVDLFAQTLIVGDDGAPDDAIDAEVRDDGGLGWLAGGRAPVDPDAAIDAEVSKTVHEAYGVTDQKAEEEAAEVESAVKLELKALLAQNLFGDLEFDGDC